MAAVGDPADRLIEGMAALGYTTVAPKLRATRSPHNPVFAMMNPARGASLWVAFLLGPIFILLTRALLVYQRRASLPGQPVPRWGAYLARDL